MSINTNPLRSTLSIEGSNSSVSSADGTVKGVVSKVTTESEKEKKWSDLRRHPEPRSTQCHTFYSVRHMHISLSRLKSQGNGRLWLSAGRDRYWKYFIAE